MDKSVRPIFKLSCVENNESRGRGARVGGGEWMEIKMEGASAQSEGKMWQGKTERV